MATLVHAFVYTSPFRPKDAHIPFSVRRGRVRSSGGHLSGELRLACAYGAFVADALGASVRA